MTIHKIKNRGFTLVETLIAVFILATSIAAPLTIASRGLNNATTARNQITAFYLAEDALEYVRFARDTNNLAGNNWITGDGSASATNLSNCTNAFGCYLDSTLQNPTSPAACLSGWCTLPSTNSQLKYLYYSSSGFYWYSSANSVKTPFVRKVTLTPINSDEYLLMVTVYWQDVGVVHTVTLNENIFNWQ